MLSWLLFSKEVLDEIFHLAVANYLQRNVNGVNQSADFLIGIVCAGTQHDGHQPLQELVMSGTYCLQVRAGCISDTSKYSDVGLKRSRHFPRNDWEEKFCKYHRLWLSGDIWRCSNSQNSLGKHRGWALHIPSPAHTLCSLVPVDVPAVSILVWVRCALLKWISCLSPYALVHSSQRAHAPFRWH